jgi:hypothetical protein
MHRRSPSFPLLKRALLNTHLDHGAIASLVITSEVSHATIADLEDGKRGAYRSTVRKLAKALKVQPHESPEE